MTNRTVQLTVQVSTDSIREAFETHGDAMEFICKLDLAIADAGFTEDLIKSLLKSLSGDLNEIEWVDLMHELKGLKNV